MTAVVPMQYKADCAIIYIFTFIVICVQNTLVLARCDTLDSAV